MVNFDNGWAIFRVLLIARFVFFVAILQYLAFLDLVEVVVFIVH